jgi:hypothetical protein
MMRQTRQYHQDSGLRIMLEWWLGGSLVHPSTFLVAVIWMSRAGLRCCWSNGGTGLIRFARIGRKLGVRKENQHAIIKVGQTVVLPFLYITSENESLDPALRLNYHYFARRMELTYFNPHFWSWESATISCVKFAGGKVWIKGCNPHSPLVVQRLSSILSIDTPA